MRCTPKKTVLAIKDSGNNGIFQVKENQATLLDDCKLVAGCEQASGEYRSPPEKAHGRIEERTVTVWHDFTTTNPDWHGLFGTLIRVERRNARKNTKTKAWEQTNETAWFLATCTLDAQTAAHHIRQHWGIENRSHYVRDNAFAEDASRIRKNPTSIARLRSFALNISRAHNNTNIALSLYENSLSIHNTLNLIGAH
jgi:predicted transposase YbfD/YdcC